MNLCKCGCGKESKRNFCLGHNLSVINKSGVLWTKERKEKHHDMLVNRWKDKQCPFSNFKGKTYEEIYGVERANEIKEKKSVALRFERKEVICPCGKPFFVLLKSAQKHCSPKCANKYRIHIPWNTGLTKETDERVAKSGRSGSKTKTGRKYEDFLGVEQAKITKEKQSKAKLGKKKSKTHCLHISQTRSRLIQEGTLNPTLNSKQYKQGHFFSNKNNKVLFHRSGYELQAFKLLEQLSHVSKYEYECLSIPYEFEDKLFIYTPDILVTYTDGRKEVIEVKPQDKLSDLRVIAKISALRNYCKDNNLICSIWTEEMLFSKKA